MEFLVALRTLNVGTQKQDIFQLKHTMRENHRSLCSKMFDVESQLNSTVAAQDTLLAVRTKMDSMEARMTAQEAALEKLTASMNALTRSLEHNIRRAPKGA